MLAALRCVSESAHLLRTRTTQTNARVPAAAELATAIDTAMETLASRARDDDARTLPPLRQLHDLLIADAGDDDFSALVETELDEIVDALDTVGHLLGMERAETDAA